MSGIPLPLKRKRRGVISPTLGLSKWVTWPFTILIMLSGLRPRLFSKIKKFSFLISSMSMTINSSSSTFTKIYGGRLCCCIIFMILRWQESKILGNCPKKWFIERSKKFKGLVFSIIFQLLTLRSKTVQTATSTQGLIKTISLNPKTTSK